MKQYECTTKINAIKKICELLGEKYNKFNKEQWLVYFNDLLKMKDASDTVDCIGYDKEKDEEFDCSVFFGYDYSNKMWYVGMERDK